MVDVYNKPPCARAEAEKTSCSLKTQSMYSSCSGSSFRCEKALEIKEIYELMLKRRKRNKYFRRNNFVAEEVLRDVIRLLRSSIALCDMHWSLSPFAETVCQEVSRRRRLMDSWSMGSFELLEKALGMNYCSL